MNPRRMKSSLWPLGLLGPWFVIGALLIAVGATGCVTTASDIDEDTAAHRFEDRQVVVVVHGMGRTGFSMRSLEHTLRDEGYEVVNWSYSSTCCSADELGDELRADLELIADGAPENIHFVAHSLGNIIVQVALDGAEPDPGGRFVMLAPPNRGSASADRYVDWLGWLLTPMDDLTTDDNSTIHSLETPKQWDIGVIAGQYDGKVSISESRHPAQDAHTVVPSRHTFIMSRDDVHQLTEAFLESGEF